MFSSRTPADLTPNRLAEALNEAKAAGRRLLDLTESNPTRAGFDYPADLLRPLSDRRALTYTPTPFGLAEARLAIARDFARRGVQLSPERLVLTASTSEAYACLFKLLTDAGDEVLVPTPSYPLFDHLARLDQVVARPYALDVECGWRIDFDSLRGALTSRSRAILVVSPNNPTGSFVKPDELEQLVEVAAAHELALLVDEVFSDYELIPGARAAAGLVANRTDVLSFSLGGLSKSVGLPQVKLSWIGAAGPRELVAPALDRLELICDTYLSVSTPAQIATEELLSRGAAVREQIARRISANYRDLAQRVSEMPACRVVPSEGGWYGVLEVPSLESEEALVLELLRKDGVLVHPGYFFDFPKETYLIVSLLAPEASFAEGVDRIVRHFDCAVASRE
jgi:aspartate/methionine/tyrosine aminotransferase